MKTVITRADQDIARLDVKLAERLGEPVDPRVRAIPEMDRSKLAAVRHRITRADQNIARRPAPVSSHERTPTSGRTAQGKIEPE